jgi:hypothetical protein
MTIFPFSESTGLMIVSDHVPSGTAHTVLAPGASLSTCSLSALFPILAFSQSREDEFTKSVNPSQNHLSEVQAQPKLRQSMKAHSARYDTFEQFEFQEWTKAEHD